MPQATEAQAWLTWLLTLSLVYIAGTVGGLTHSSAQVQVRRLQFLVWRDRTIVGRGGVVEGDGVVGEGEGGLDESRDLDEYFYE